MAADSTIHYFSAAVCRLRSAVLFENEDFKHQYNIEGRTAGVGVPFFCADFVEVAAEEFPVDEGVECRQEVIEFVDFIELCVEVEEAELSFGFAHRGRQSGESKNVDRIPTCSDASSTLTENQRIFRGALMKVATDGAFGRAYAPISVSCIGLY